MALHCSTHQGTLADHQAECLGKRFVGEGLSSTYRGKSKAYHSLGPHNTIYIFRLINASLKLPHHTCQCLVAVARNELVEPAQRNEHCYLVVSQYHFCILVYNHTAEQAVTDIASCAIYEA